MSTGVQVRPGSPVTGASVKGPKQNAALSGARKAQVVSMPVEGNRLSADDLMQFLSDRATELELMVSDDAAAADDNAVEIEVSAEDLLAQDPFPSEAVVPTAHAEPNDGHYWSYRTHMQQLEEAYAPPAEPVVEQSQAQAVKASPKIKRKKKAAQAKISPRPVADAENTAGPTTIDDMVSLLKESHPDRPIEHTSDPEEAMRLMDEMGQGAFIVRVERQRSKTRPISFNDRMPWASRENACNFVIILCLVLMMPLFLQMLRNLFSPCCSRRRASFAKASPSHYDGKPLSNDALIKVAVKLARQNIDAATRGLDLKNESTLMKAFQTEVLTKLRSSLSSSASQRRRDQSSILAAVRRVLSEKNQKSANYDKQLKKAARKAARKSAGSASGLGLMKLPGISRRVSVVTTVLIPAVLLLDTVENSVKIDKIAYMLAMTTPFDAMTVDEAQARKDLAKFILDNQS